MGLNPQQEEVANHFTGRAWVVAGPGSGKTGTLKERIGRLLDRGVDPFNILCLTFTNKAADEMKERLVGTYGERVKKVMGCTFHSLCVRILREYGSHIGYGSHFTIFDTSDQESLISKLARQKHAANGDGEDDDKAALTKPQLKKLCKVINDWRERLGTDSELADLREEGQDIRNDEELEILRSYLTTMRQHNQIDFSGLLSETVKLLKGHDDIRDALQRRFLFIQVDEYQDTNVAQNALVELLAGPEDNVVAVGDLDQSIYEWRGASPNNVKDFINHGKGKHGCKEYVLGINYRSTPEILAVADKLIRHVPNRKHIDLVAHNPSNGFTPSLTVYPNPDAEADDIAVTIQRFISRNVSPKQIAVFYRLNDMSLPLQKALMRRQIPFKVVGGMGFFDRTEIKDCLAMLRLLANPKDSASFERIIKRLTAGVGDKTIGAIENYAQEHNIDLIAAMGKPEEYCGTGKRGQTVAEVIRKSHYMFGFDKSGMAPEKVLDEVVKRTNYLQWIKEHEPETDKANDRQRNVSGLIEDVAKYCSQNAGSGLPEYLQYITLLTSAEEKDKGEQVQLMSIHGSKGLEFDAVFTIGVEKGLLPFDKAVKERPEYGMAEERRLCYVAFTRAKKLLKVSWCKIRPMYGSQKIDPKCPSVFLMESGLMSKEEYGKHLIYLGASDEPVEDQYAQ